MCEVHAAAEKWKLVLQNVKNFIFLVSGSDVEMSALETADYTGKEIQASVKILIQTLKDFDTSVNSCLPEDESGKDTVIKQDIDKGSNSVSTTGINQSSASESVSCSGDNASRKQKRKLSVQECSGSVKKKTLNDVELQNSCDNEQILSQCTTTDQADEGTTVVSAYDLSLVQIKAPKAEIERRIAAFIEQKQSQLNENNRREFCSAIPDTDGAEESCARTDAVFVPRASGKSHLKVSRVVNAYGPQTNHILGPGLEPGTSSSATTVVKQEPVSEGLEERVANMETHLKMKGSGVSKSSLFSRVKALEESILFLEGLSPEYFSHGPPNVKRIKREPESRSFDSQHKELSLADIDRKIRNLKETLLKKSAAG